MIMSNKAHWEQVYTTKHPEQVSWYMSEPVISLELIRATGIGMQDRIIDVGGGASVLVDRLVAQGRRHVAVLDISGAALAYARSRLADGAQAVEWFEADVTAFSPPHPFSLWHDRAVFHFLTTKDARTKYVAVLSAAVPPGGHVIMATFAKGGPDKCSGLDIVQYDAPSMCAELGDGFALQETREELHITPRQTEQKFMYFRFVRR
jgi:SAM-dependent methyltransferase